MKLFKISTEHFEYDQHDAFIIRAADEAEARKIAATNAGMDQWGNGKEFLNSERSECVEVTIDGPTACILGSFNAS